MAVTFDEALTELGIDRDAGPVEARRAYLKLLKTRRPETDPQGFMRLREAFDHVKAAHAAHETFRLAIEAHAAALEPAEPPPVAVPEPVAPADPVAPAEPQAAEGTATEDEEDEEPPSEAEVDRLLVRGDRAGAAYELGCLFDAAVEDLGRQPDFFKAMRLLLDLHEHAELGEARLLEERVVAWLHASGMEVRMIRGNLAVAWAMTRELGALRPKFPVKVRKLIARGVRTGNLQEVQKALVALRDRRPSVAEEAAERLRARAPVLAEQFANILDPPAPPRVTSTSRGSGPQPLWIIFVLVLPLLRLLASSSTTSAPDRVRDRERAAMTEQDSRRTDPAMSDRKLAVVSQARRVSEYATARVGASLAIVEYAKMDLLAKAIVVHASAGRCSWAWESMRALEGLGSAGDEAAGIEVAALDRALTMFCPSDVKP